VATILIVEDEAAIVRLVRDYLVHDGFQAIAAGTVSEALQRIRMDKPDLLVLDLGLPGRNGLDLLREIRRNGSDDLPVIILTARGEETDRIVGLELGADDYMVKPFSPKELVARVRAVLRRVESRGATDREQLEVGNLGIDVPRMRVTRGETPIDLTATEFQILVAMAREPGRVFTRANLLDVIHGMAIEAYERAIDAHIKNLRRKLEPDPSHPRYVQTVHGVGYRMTDDPPR
jgi:DNA-binding response OmpR family regulator